MRYSVDGLMYEPTQNVSDSNFPRLRTEKWKGETGRLPGITSQSVLTKSVVLPWKLSYYQPRGASGSRA